MNMKQVCFGLIQCLTQSQDTQGIGLRQTQGEVRNAAILQAIECLGQAAAPKGNDRRFDCRPSAFQEIEHHFLSTAQPHVVD
jgi:hypothetical protein